jgi:hypothetical protein
MKAVVQAYWLPKSGNSPNEYEDAYWPRRSPAGDVDSLRLSVADGATEASFSGPWARLLSRAYCARRLAPDQLREGLRRLERRWRRHVNRKPLPWYAEQKLESGAFAAIVGVEVNAETRNWIAFAVGDCCVFQTRGEEILAKFPLDAAEKFDNRPLLLSSLSQNNGDALSSLRTTGGSWSPGDTFFLMSDALAAWFLRYASLPGGDAVFFLKDLTSQADFAAFIESQQRDKFKDGAPMMRNDDMTLLACTFT